MAVPYEDQITAQRKGVTLRLWPWSVEHSSALNEPFVTAGNRVYSIASQHGEFPEIGWRQPREMAGVWDHPMKLLDGFWFGVTTGQADLTHQLEDICWLTQASRWRMSPGEIEMTYALEQFGSLTAIRREYGVNDAEGLIVRLELRNQGSEALHLTLHFLARTDLRAAWLGENRLAWRDGRDEAVYLDDNGCIAAYNTVNPAFVLFGATQRPTVSATGTELWATQQTHGQGISGLLRYTLTIPPESAHEMVFIIAGSTQSSAAATATFQQLCENADTFCRLQQERYEHILTRCALHSGDELMDAAFGWAKTSLQMLERHVPGIGRGIAAGLPDFPWWFADDISYSTLPLVASGQFELAKESLRTIARYSKARHTDGQVVHEVLTQGHVHDAGHLVEIPLFLRAVYHTFQWSGDRAFLAELYDFCKRGLLATVLGTHDADGDLCAEGTGMVETRELQHGGAFEILDVAAYTYEALLCLAVMAEEVGDAEIVPDLRDKASRLREHINSAWWIDEEGLFGDIYTSAQALAHSTYLLKAEKALWPGDVIELERTEMLLNNYAARSRITHESPTTERPWLLKHMIGATPMETGLASAPHAEQALSQLESDEFTGPWGLYLNPESQRVTMTLPVGIIATAEARYQRMDKALFYAEKIASTLFHGMPGAFSEVSPNEGCFMQAWSSYGIIWPVVAYFFGFHPDAAHKRVTFIPHLPGTWYNVWLEQVRVGTATMNLSVNRSDEEVIVCLETSDSEYAITIGYMCPVERHPASVTLNGHSIDYHRESVEAHRVTEAFSALVQSSPGTGLRRYEFIVRW